MNDELWRVQLRTGEIRTMTLEALDRAFDEGLIDARVTVLAPGSSSWTTLAEAAGLEDELTEETPSLSPVAISGPASSSAAAFSRSDEPDSDPELPDAFDMPLRSPRRSLLIGAIPGVLAVVAALVVVAAKLGASPPSDVKVTTAVQAPFAAEPLPAPAAPATKPAVAEPATETKPVLSDWQKQMLIESDKAREDKTRAKSQEKVEKLQKRKPQPKVSPGLLNGGDRFDPLNGQL